MTTISLNVNNKDYTLSVQNNWTLLKVLRETLQLTGSKFGCGSGDCGACKVLIDGEAKNACTVLAARLEGKKIITIEGLSKGKDLHPVQRAYIDAGAIACGYCTPGMVISTVSLLDKTPRPSHNEISEALDNNLCRCTGYKKIKDAVLLAAEYMQEVQV